MFDFSKAEVPSQNQYLRPGVYPLTIHSAEFSHPEGKSPLLKIVFIHKNGATVSSNFYITEKTVGMFQYIHTEYFGSKCEKNFNTAKELGEYFATQLLYKPIEKYIVVGGERVNGKVYSRIGLYFITSENVYPLGEFEENSSLWSKFIKESKDESPITNNVMVSSSPSPFPNTSVPNSDGLPF